MNYPKTLSLLSIGESAYVTGLTATGGIRRRLLDLGIIEGTKISCIQQSPFGDPIAYLVRGAVIALRQEDAKAILVS